ncbi:MAG: hypothetical protein MJZ88_06235 [Paludibacteraceae bacterium]|nr:hypothetical protein [Paludibacteraceae bacterium]
MKKVLFSIIAIMLMASCVKRTDVIISWMVANTGDIYPSEAVQVLNCYDQAAQDLGYTLIQDRHMFILPNQPNIKKAKQVAAEIANNAYQQASQLNVRYDEFSVAVDVEGSDMFPRETACSHKYGAATKPNAKRGLTIVAQLSEDWFSLYDVKVKYTFPGDSANFNSGEMKLTENGTGTEYNPLTGETITYKLYEGVFEKELSNTGKGAYYLEMTRNAKQAEQDKEYYFYSYITAHAGYLGGGPMEEKSGELFSSKKGSSLNEETQGTIIELPIRHGSYELK